jgi:hypothetical protein
MVAARVSVRPPPPITIVTVSRVPPRGARQRAWRDPNRSGERVSEMPDSPQKSCVCWTSRTRARTLRPRLSANVSGGSSGPFSQPLTARSEYGDPLAGPGTNVATGPFGSVQSPSSRGPQPHPIRYGTAKLVSGEKQLRVLSAFVERVGVVGGCCRRSWSVSAS